MWGVGGVGWIIGGDAWEVGMYAGGCVMRVVGEGWKLGLIWWKYG